MTELEMIEFYARLVKVASHWRRSLGCGWQRLKPTIKAVCSRSRLLRVNVIALSLWLLFPLLLRMTSDWIGLLAAFQVMTAAVRLRNAPAAKALAAFSTLSEAPNSCAGE